MDLVISSIEKYQLVLQFLHLQLPSERVSLHQQPAQRASPLNLRSQESCSGQRMYNRLPTTVRMNTA